MTQHRLTATGQHVEVSAHAPGHRFVVHGDGLVGQFELEGDVLRRAELTLDLSTLSADDRLKDHELRRFLDLSKNPRARAVLVGTAPLTRRGASLEGRAAFHFSIGAQKAEVSVQLSGSATAPTAFFTIRFTALGFKPPRLLLFSVKDELSVTVRLHTEETAPPSV